MPKEGPMYPAVIQEYLTPTTVDEALDVLRRRPRETRVIAGGMSLMQLMKARQAEPACLVDLRKVASLRGIRIDGAGVRIGAMVRYRELVADARLHVAFGGLGDSARTIGDRQVLHPGPIRGELCFNDKPADLPP